MGSKRNLVIGGVVVVAVILIGWLAFKDSPTDNGSEISPSPSPTLSESPVVQATPVLYIVHLNSQGPNPKSLTIRRGDAVSFVNETGARFWPASDPYPTNNLCPDFNARRTLEPGEKYTLTFTTANTCTYHDNLNPSDSTSRGTIVVQ